MNRYSSVALDHASLHFDSAPDGVHDARKFHEHAVPSSLDDPPTVLRDLRVDHIFPMGLKLSERAFFVGRHKPRVASHIGCENGG